MDKIVRNIIRLCGDLSIPASKTILHVSIPDQRLKLFQDSNLVSEHVISTSTNNPSCVEDSGGTPLGLHRIEQKIGNDAKAGTVFFARVSTEKKFWDFDEKIQSRNLITSRIMWLRGLELNKNAGDGVDSFARYIYIHGTNHENRLGTPASGGCVLLSNEEIIRLYDKIPAGSLVYIDEHNTML